MTTAPTLRDEQIARTRERLLEAAAQLLAEDQELGFRAIAERAGVSAPTVYRHFASPEELMPDLLVHLERRLGVTEHPTSLAGFAEMVPRLFASFQENQVYMRAWMRAPKAQAVRELNWHRRATSIANGLPDIPVLRDPDHAQRFAGLMLVLAGSPTWHAITEVTDLRGDDAGRLVAWAMNALADAAERDPGTLAEALTPTHDPEDQP
jgi:AcrR family transcriptional regulator